MQRADTVGVFQIESRAQMATLPRLRPACFYDVAMQVAIVRPGPIIGHLTHPLIRRRTGLEPVTYLDPSVDALVAPILKRTLGVILFQEQMLELAMVLAQFSGSEAEELRRSMGLVKNNGRLERALAKLAAALRRAGRNEEVVRKVTDSAVAFAAYGFPESHALSFALLAYASTWLKFHRPAEFVASLLNNQPMGFYSPATLIQDARRHGLKVKPVCVLASEWECSVEADDTLRIGLAQVKGVRESAVRTWLNQRRTAAPRTLAAFLAHTPFNTPELRSLAAVGALNALASHRRAALWQIEAAWTDDEALLRRLAAQEAATIPTDVEGQTATSVPFSPLPAMTLAERLEADFAGLELTAGIHPMALARSRLPDAWRACDLPLGRDGEQVVIAGAVICRQRPGTAKGVVFVSLEDETGIANAIVSAALFEARRLVITQEPTLKISGVLQRAHGVIHVRAESIAALTEAAVPTGSAHDFH
jgi:error-prone DNA polymerase